MRNTRSLMSKTVLLLSLLVGTAAGDYRVTPKEVQLFWDGKTGDPAYKLVIPRWRNMKLRRFRRDKTTCAYRARSNRQLPLKPSL